MFTRSGSISKESPSNNLNLNSFEFFEALNKGEIEKVKSFFYDPSIKIWLFKDENNYTALHFSVLKNNFDLTIFIIEELKKKNGYVSSTKIRKFYKRKK